jgi:uncharacterized protein YdeI (YjbR/CyaY-like superfamily)
VAGAFVSRVSDSPTYFANATEFRTWLEHHHASARELVLGFCNKASGRGGITYSEALDEALCFGWIDGIVHKLDAERHTRRFTPRRPGSNWSKVNLGHVDRLTRMGRMHPAGLKAWAERDERKVGIYSFEQRPERFPADLAKRFQANKTAWRFWESCPPSYHRAAVWWVISAKQEATQQRRLAKLIEVSRSGRRLDGK